MSARSINPFVSRPLPSGSGLRGALGLPAAEAASIALENLLADGGGGVAEISRALRPYRLSASAVRQLFGKAYERALVHALRDEHIGDDEHRFLADLRRRLGLSDMEVSDLHAATVHPRFERALREMLEDNRIDDAERDALRRLEADLRLPGRVRERIYAAVASAAWRDSYSDAMRDRRLSPEEEADLDALASNLGLKPDLTDRSRELMDRYRLLWRIENGDIPELATTLALQREEVAYFQAECEWKELQRGTRRQSSEAPSGGLPIVPGARFRVGPVVASVQRGDLLTHVDSGQLCMTGKRLLFVGASRASSIPFSKVTGFEVFSDALLVERDTGRSPYLFLKGDLELAAVVLGALLARR